MEKIIVIDDEIEILSLFKAFFKKQNLRITTFDSLEAFMQNADKLQPSIVITDLKLGEHSGLKVIEYYLKQKYIPSLYIMSGYPDLVKRLSPEELQHVSIHEKPFDIEEFCKEIAKLEKSLV